MSTADKVLAALAPYDLKHVGGTQYRSNSPLRPGSNSHAFTITIEDGEHGAFEDKPTGEAGSLYTLAKQMGIEVEGAERPAVADTKRRYTHLADYAEAHGIPADVLQKAGWQEVTHQGRSALAFSTKGGTRYRYLDGELPVYKHDTGYQKCWYGLQRAVQIANDARQALVLCNGEISTVSAHHYGIAACCVTSGEGAIPDALLDELRAVWTGDVLVAFDCDKTGREATAKVLAQLPKAKSVDLGLGDKGDLSDFCMLNGQDSVVKLRERVQKPAAANTSAEYLAEKVAELVKLRKQEERQSPQIDDVVATLRKELARFEQQSQVVELLSFEELVRMNSAALTAAVANPQPIRGLRSNIPALDKALGGFVGGRMNVIYGDTGMGKSTLGVSIVREFVPQGAGIVLSTESPPQFWLNKLMAALSHIPSHLIESGELTPTQYSKIMDAYEMFAESKSHVLKSTSPTPAQLRASVLSVLDKQDLKWVLVDSLSKMKSPGSQGIYETTSEVADAIQDLAIETELVFIATCQIGRNVKGRDNKMAMVNDAQGSGVVEQDADAILSLYRHDYYVKMGQATPDPSFPENTALLRILKNRWMPGGDVGVMLTMVGGAGFYQLERKLMTTGGY